MPINPLTIKIAIALGLLALSAIGGYKLGHDSVMAGWNAEKSAISDATANALTKLNEQRKQKDKAAEQSEKEAWEKYQNAQVENDRINSELDSRPWRVRVITKSASCSVPDSTAASVGNGEEYTTAELPREIAAGISSIGRDADQCEAKLKSLQDWALIVVSSEVEKSD